MRERILRARVRRGATLLDQRVPGWQGRINLRSLDVSSHKRCVLGQLFQSYDDGTTALNVVGVRYGFYLLRTKRYPQLTEVWREEIRKSSVYTLAEEAEEYLRTCLKESQNPTQ